MPAASRSTIELPNPSPTGLTDRAQQNSDQRHLGELSFPPVAGWSLALNSSTLQGTSIKHQVHVPNLQTPVPTKLARIGAILSIVTVIALAAVLSSCRGFFVNPKLQTITVAPTNPSVVKGQTLQFTATGTNDDGSTANNISNLVWSSSSTAVATVNTTGLATGVTAGTATITASSAGISGTATLTVTNSALVSITISPTSAQISVSGLTGSTTQQFKANATFADGTKQDITSSATWNSSNTGVANINSGGLATAVSSGVATITATSGNITSNQATLTVTQ